MALWEYICTAGSGNGNGSGRGGVGGDDRGSAAETVRLFERAWPLLPAVGGVGSDSIRVLLQLHAGMPVVSPVEDGIGPSRMNDAVRKVGFFVVLLAVDARVAGAGGGGGVFSLAPPG